MVLAYHPDILDHPEDNQGSVELKSASATRVGTVLSTDNYLQYGVLDIKYWKSQNCI